MKAFLSSYRYRFSRASRLLKPSEFQAVFDARKACRGQWLTVHRTDAVVDAEANVGSPAEIPKKIITADTTRRLGLIVAKRIVPSAARRNLIRRILREYFRTTPDAFPAGDWIVRLHDSPFPSPARVRKGAPIPTRWQVVSSLRNDLTQILKRIAAQTRKEGAARGA